jgi:3-oxoacyl-[acyl-carrier-protein] synthase-3
LNILRAKITASSHYLPERRVTNLELQQTVDTSDSWIVERTESASGGLPQGSGNQRSRAEAANRFSKKRGIDATELDLIIVATVTPDMMFPSTACLVQHKIGAKNAWGFDLSGACSGFIYALATGRSSYPPAATRKCW